ncbi:hypothetical protein [Membranihabitans maritimus]|uniref:hypothetical protein n=1 Tax=Membranihabitans maritimus TaxID=2904244 RepID=UPI001F357633|nr:hypothetical protein [Membranihabitans maritimus]
MYNKIHSFNVLITVTLTLVMVVQACTFFYLTFDSDSSSYLNSSVVLAGMEEEVKETSLANLLLGAEEESKDEFLYNYLEIDLGYSNSHIGLDILDSECKYISKVILPPPEFLGS